MSFNLALYNNGELLIAEIGDRRQKLLAGTGRLHGRESIRRDYFSESQT